MQMLKFEFWSTVWKIRLDRQLLCLIFHIVVIQKNFPEYFSEALMEKKLQSFDG